MALEVCLGGRLYNVMVEDNLTASQLLDGGCLTQKVTMILLNQICTFVAFSGSLQLLPKFQGTLQNLHFIWWDAWTAKEVTFDQKVSMKSVTQDGNIYNPSGTLSGGSKPSTSGILIKVLELKKVEGLLKDHQSKLEPDISKKKSDINKSSTTVKIMQRELQGIEIETEKLASELEAANREAEETDQVVELAREEHEGWKKKLKQAKAGLDRLEADQNKMWKKVNPKVLHMIDRFLA
ncbi:expressed protein [Phakopsora pachyrhizi]|uniref:Expressed protein n=1 Tax=Phakopsora pachyrhizi TaxID=170000 RepID=A0AAV0AM48_PHAPC|nr:expressed protein [Phakopsora pachyrhizi]